MRNSAEASAPACELHFVPPDVLPGASFHLVRARATWSDASPTEGWGRDSCLERAVQKATGEAVERAAFGRMPASAFRAAACDLPAYLAPAGLVMYRDGQYDAAGFPFHRFDPGADRWWLPATRVGDGRRVAVPAECTCAAGALPEEYRRRLLTRATTSGCAVGNGLAEALERATLELVERDAFMRHWLAQEPGLAVMPATLPHAAAARIQRLMDAGCEAGVQCLHHGIHPTWLAWARHEALHFTCVGAASGAEAEGALASAMNEMETAALARLAGVPAEGVRAEEVRSPADHGALYATAHGFRLADAVLHARQAVDFRCVASDFPLRDGQLHARLRERGHSPHWVDLGFPEARHLLPGRDLAAVRVFAPGLIPIAFGHGLQPLGAVPALAAGADSLHPFS